MYSIEQVSPGHPLWETAYHHLVHCDQWQWVSDGDRLRDGVVVLAAVTEQRVVANLSLLIQPIANLGEATGSRAMLLEGFVQTFHVDEGWRRRGVGRALQLAAIEASRRLGCYQMRSWSSVDKAANYWLKLGLGFAFCPAAEYHGGRRIEGGYFVCRLDSRDREPQP